jgi:hypothetical protein
MKRVLFGTVAFGAMAACLALTGPVLAAECRVVVLRDVAAIENAWSMEERGSVMKEPTQYRIAKGYLGGMGMSATNYSNLAGGGNAATKVYIPVASYCFHGGYCYPVWVTVFRDDLSRTDQALSLEGCHVGKLFSSDDRYDYYSVEP